MSHSMMTNAYQTLSPFVWPLATRQAVTLVADPATRLLWVHDGRVWLTQQCAHGTPEDIWLEAGQSHTLPAATEWVAEAWPQARLSVTQAAPAVIKSAGGTSWRRSWRAVSAAAGLRA